MTARKRAPAKRRPRAPLPAAGPAGGSDWRDRTLVRLRKVIRRADPDMIEEVKWRKPSNPDGVPVWSHDGIVCVGNVLKNAVRLTFPFGAEIPDPQRLFNARLDSRTTRALDVHATDVVDEAALRTLLRAAVGRNVARRRGP